MCSFDVTSLFTNVPLDETIDICVDSLYRDPSIPKPPFPEEIFVELINSTTKGVEFSFNNTMYRQTDGISMGSPLGPILAGIFVGFYEDILFKQGVLPASYFRYVDDTFATFSSVEIGLKFFDRLNGLHLSLKFTMEIEQNEALPFLDVLVQRREKDFITSLYRKKTFTGLYINWHSFCPLSRKINLIKTLTHRALMICSDCTLKGELQNISEILLDNGYPKSVVDRHINNKLKSFGEPKSYGPEKCPLTIKLPWLGSVSSTFADQISNTITGCFFSTKVRVLFKTRTILPSFTKDSLPTFHMNLTIYQFKCRCDAVYVGRTSKRLESRIKEHVSNSTLRHISNGTTPPSTVDSAIGQHLLTHINCAAHYDSCAFSILHRGRTKHHLRVLEAIYITLRRPSLCTQKNLSPTLGLLRGLL